MHECRSPPLEVELGLGGEEDVHIVVVGAAHAVVKAAAKPPQVSARGGGSLAEKGEQGHKRHELAPRFVGALGTTAIALRHFTAEGWLTACIG
jgi:hypothetical protein